jgi:hypothetical protein
VTPGAAGPGPYTFRYWVNDVTPPTIRLAVRTVKAGARLRFTVTDAGSGVDPQSFEATIDGKAATVTPAKGGAVVSLARLAAGRHRVALVASDYQELKNMENVPQILPNTRTFAATFTVR